MAIENSISINDKPVFYRKVGVGQPVVLVHGFSEDGTVWENQVEYLKNKFQLIIPDLPGSGQSIDNKQFAIGNKGEALAGNDEWSMEYFAECVHRILDHENISTANMIGHSMGGYITLVFADKYPDRLQSFG